MEFWEEEISRKFHSGYNCAMSVFSAAAELLDYDEEDIVRLAAGFGGGMGHGGMCGCVTGAYMALGLAFAPEDPADAEQKQLFAEKKKAFEEAFSAVFPGYTCPNLLGGLNTADPEDKAKVAALGLRDTVCTPAVLHAARTVRGLIEEG